MKRLITIITALVVGMLAVTGTADARPKPTPKLASVTLSFVDGADGLDGTLVMRVDGAPPGTVTYTGDGIDGTSRPDLAVRGFDSTLTQGLHTGMKAVSPDECPSEPEPYRALAWISFDRSGSIDGFIWHFDMVVSRAEAKKGCTVRVEERLTIRALEDRELLPGEEPLMFDPRTGELSGSFNLHWYDADAANPHVQLARTAMRFTITIDQ